MLPHFQSHYEERFYALDQIVKNHKEKSTFEDFVSSVFSPAPLANLFVTSDPYSRPSSVASTSVHSDFSSNYEDTSSSVLRPRARTDASALSNSTTTITLDSHDSTDAHSPKNLKKLTAAIRANINNNVARVNRPLSTRVDDGLVVTSTSANHHHNSSPPMSSGKKR